jgi:DNA end-binding protein Ku
MRKSIAPSTFTVSTNPRLPDRARQYLRIGRQRRHHTIEIEKFVPLADIDVRFFDSPYYLIPEGQVGLDAFAVIRDAMASKKMVGVGRVVLQKRERPILLEPFGKGLRGMTLRYPYEVRSETEYFEDIPEVKLAPDMLKLAEHIIDTKAGDFEPAEFIESL